jgi:hypothetical protein
MCTNRSNIATSVARSWLESKSSAASTLVRLSFQNLQQALLIERRTAPKLAVQGEPMKVTTSIDVIASPLNIDILIFFIITPVKQEL